MKKFFKKYGINLLGSAIMTALLVVLFLILLDVPTAKVYFDNITSRLDKITLFIGAVSAFYVYYDQRSETKRTAYTEIAMEILNIEKTIEDLKRLMYDSKLGNITIYESPAIIQKDIWSVRNIYSCEIWIMRTFKLLINSTLVHLPSKAHELIFFKV